MPVSRSPAATVIPSPTPPAGTAPAIPGLTPGDAANADRVKRASLRRAVAINLTRKVGAPGVKWILDAWARGVPDVEIGARFGVTSACAGRWRRACGASVFTLFPEVSAVFAARSRDPRAR